MLPTASGPSTPLPKLPEWLTPQARGSGSMPSTMRLTAPIDVQALGCDFLVCSAYKFFGPHAGVVWGREDLLEKLHAYKVRPAGNRPPDKFETGTQNHEAQAGIRAAVEYLAEIGEKFGSPFAEDFPGFQGGEGS